MLNPSSCTPDNETVLDSFDWCMEWLHDNQNEESVDEAITVSNGPEYCILYCSSRGSVSFPTRAEVYTRIPPLLSENKGVKPIPLLISRYKSVRV